MGKPFGASPRGVFCHDGRRFFHSVDRGRPVPGRGAGQGSEAPVEFVTLNPGHFHAALVQKFPLDGVSKTVHVFAPLGFDLQQHLGRIASFNGRADNPTDWTLKVHAGADYLQAFKKEKPGNVVVISGRNRTKIDLIEAAVDAGLNVLVDKPWVIASENLPRLEKVLAKAKEKGLVAYDIMTERFEASNALQKALINTADVFGVIQIGTKEEPAVYMENVHHLMKTVAGRPNLRPAWFFDSNEQGEGMNDTGNHLIDLIQWSLFPGQSLGVERDVRLVDAFRFPTVITPKDFMRVTGLSTIPEPHKGRIRKGKLPLYVNNSASFTIRGIHIKTLQMWDWKARPGAKDAHFAVYRGSKSKVEIRQGRKQRYRPEVYVVPNRGENVKDIESALRQRVEELQGDFPGIAVRRLGRRFQIMIPKALRVGHEAHFAQVTRKYLGYLKDPASVPAWEGANMLTKYFIATKSTELSRKGKDKPARRLAPR